MKTPKMIVFDYGNTLLHEPDIDFVRGQRALLPYITSNPDSLSPEYISAYAADLFEQFAAARSLGMEVHAFHFQRLLYESLGIAFSIGWKEVEAVVWNAASPGAMMPDADKIIDFVNQNGFLSGVISNISWSEDALTQRLNRFLPRNQFSFVIASSEYGFRKPSPRLFALALRKAGLPPGEVWYCGDNPRADVEGAAGVGIFPVWYDFHAKREKFYKPQHALPACGHLYVREWAELIDILERLAAQA